MSEEYPTIYTFWCEFIDRDGKSRYREFEPDMHYGGSGWFPEFASGWETEQQAMNALPLLRDAAHRLGKTFAHDYVRVNVSLMVGDDGEQDFQPVYEEEIVLD